MKNKLKIISSIIFILFMSLLFFSPPFIKNSFTEADFSNGALDLTFDPGLGANNVIHSTLLLSNNKIIIGGNFTTYNGTSVGRIARLNADGSLDTSFNSGSGANDTIWSILLQSDNKIIIGGNFTTYNGTSVGYIARLNADGSLDTSFNPGSELVSSVFSISLQPDNKIIIGGTFSHVEGFNSVKNYVTRLNSDGSVDGTFNSLGSGANNNIDFVSLQPDNKIIIGGAFTSYNGTSVSRIARLNADGSLDTSFDPGSGANNRVYSVSLQEDNKIIIGGGFTSYNGTSAGRIARLNADGSLDTSFNSGSEANDYVVKILLQPDNKIIIGGGFTSYNGTSAGCIARLNADGSLDTSFNSGSGADNVVRSISLQPDNKIIIGGWFDTYNGTSRNKIARLALSSSYTVTPSAEPHGTISPDTAQTISSGLTTTFTVTPDNGYSASVGGTCGGNLVGTTYTTSAIIADCTVDASFTLIPPSTYSISGYIKDYELVKNIIGATVTLDNGSTQTTDTSDNNGYYEFTDVPAGGNYTISISKDDSLFVGLNTIDTGMIRAYIVNDTYFNGQSYEIYKKIASNVHNAGATAYLVNTSDTGIIRSRMVAPGSSNNFPHGQWRFYPSSASLNTSNYLTSNLSILTINNLSANQTNQDFIGIKMGDVNNSWN